MHWDIIMCLVSNERRENALDNEAYSLIKFCMAMKISHWWNGFSFYWDALYYGFNHGSFILQPNLVVKSELDCRWTQLSFHVVWRRQIKFHHYPHFLDSQQPMRNPICAPFKGLGQRPNKWKRLIPNYNIRRCGFLDIFFLLFHLSRIQIQNLEKQLPCSSFGLNVFFFFFGGGGWTCCFCNALITIQVICGLTRLQKGMKLQQTTPLLGGLDLKLILKEWKGTGGVVWTAK